MNAECCTAGPEQRRQRRVRRRASWLVLASTALLTVAVPKCPLCLGAQLAFVGVGFGAASAVAPLIAPLGGALALFALVRYVAHARELRG